MSCHPCDQSEAQGVEGPALAFAFACSAVLPKNPNLSQRITPPLWFRSEIGPDFKRPQAPELSAGRLDGNYRMAGDTLKTVHSPHADIGRLIPSWVTGNAEFSH
jgi:hypothetical protein